MDEFLDPDGDISELRAKMVTIATTLAERLDMSDDDLDDLITSLLMGDDEFLREKARWFVGATRH